ncbi:peptidase [Salmonella enterica subsp. enterica serovar Poona]|nr:peptidase [Salmonella enterica subsp. enterica serovar Poona]
MPGTHTAMDGRTVTFTPENCLDLAASYDATLSEAPFVIGHPSLTAPAYGWADRFEFRDGMVFAAPKQVIPAFAEAFNAGQYKKRSLSIYLPDTPGNPKPGHYYPRHVGFLGAIPPAVKGLPDVRFAECHGENAPLEFALPWENDNLASLFQGLRDWLIEQGGVDKADSVLPQWRIQTILDTPAEQDAPLIPALAYAEENNVDPNKTTADTPPDFAEREAALAAREAELAQKELAARQRDEQARREAIVAFAGTLVTDGKILPRQQNTVVEVLMNLPVEPLSFAEGDKTVSQTPEALLREILSTKPAVVDFAEKSGNADRAVDFADAGAVADQAVAWQAEQKKLGRQVSVTEAVNHITGGKK